MSISQPSFQPNFHTADELDRWYDASVLLTQHGIRQTAERQEDHVAAHFLDYEHIGIRIKNSKENERILDLTWRYRIDVWQKIQRVLPNPKKYKKRGAFSSDHMNELLLLMPDDLRDIAADCVTMEYTEHFRRNYAKEDPEFAELYDYEGADANDGCEEIMQIINHRYPGQLQRLYNQIRSGTLGSDGSTKG